MAIGATSCSDSEKENPTPVDIQRNLLVTALKSNPDLSQFTEAFQALDLSSSQATGLTLLALTNDAIAAENDGLTTELLRQHILEEAYIPSQLSQMATVKSLGGAELVVKTTEGMVALNNTAIGLQLAVGNSVLYTLDKAIPSYNAYLGLDEKFSVATNKVLRLRPEMIDLDDATFEWTQEFKGAKAVVSDKPDFDFITLDAGEYTLTLKATKPSGEIPEFSKTALVTVTAPEEEYSPFISRIIDFLPAPGINLNSGWKDNQGVQATTKDEVFNDIYLGLSKGSGNYSLGAFGGYMIVGFDHTIINKSGYCDFTTKYQGGNNTMVSPSIIWVAFDANGNGKPDDDEWYEIKGSEYGKDKDLGIHTYTYSTTQENQSYAWEREDGTKGSITPPPLVKSPIPQVPFWITEGTYALSGRELDTYIDPANMFANPTPFAWGYAGNQLNNTAAAAIDIDWAIDAKGNSVHLPGVDFIKVVNATQKMRQMQGECRYQVQSIEDLHLQEIAFTPEQAQGSN